MPKLEYQKSNTPESSDTTFDLFHYVGNIIQHAEIQSAIFSDNLQLAGYNLRDRFSHLGKTPTCDGRMDGHTMAASTALA